MRRISGRAATLLVVLSASAALAHQGVKNPAVKARMDSMAEIQENTKFLGSMAKGAISFDGGKARTAASVIAENALLMPALFETEEVDPVSEALPEIWTRFDDFVRKAEALAGVARAAAKGIETPDDLGTALADIGETCKACHEIYRE